MALGGEVVYLVGTDRADDLDQGAGVGHVAPVELDRALLLRIADPFTEVQMLDPSRIERRTPAQHAMDFITLVDEEFRQERPVLAGDAGN